MHHRVSFVRWLFRARRAPTRVCVPVELSEAAGCPRVSEERLAEWVQLSWGAELG